MAVLSQKDTLKLNIPQRRVIFLMTFSGILLFLIILFNILLLNNFNREEIIRKIIKDGNKVTDQNILGYVRLKIIIIILSNSILFAGFFIMIWMGINKKRYGYLFGVFWLLIFGGNAISIPFYFVNGFSAYSLISLILYSILAFIMFLWIIELKLFRTRMRISLARKRSGISKTIGPERY